jgi:hypothetical protein
VIRELTGNLGVDRLLHVRAGAAAPASGATERALDQMAALRVDAVEEYLAWALLEPERGRFDGVAPRATAVAARARGLRYVVYPWPHVVPDWFAASADFVPMRCLEHGATVGWPSPFAPATRAAQRRLLEGLHAALGSEIDALVLAFPADYGEFGFPTGFGAWVSPPRPPHDHVHVGFWFGDPHAVAAWGEFAAAVGAPRDPGEALRDPASRPSLARFGARSLAEYAAGVLADARALFPALPLWIKVGHGGEQAEYGIDVAELAAVAARHGAGLRTTMATLPTLHQQRIATACRVHAVPLGSEAPLDVGRARTIARRFDDASCGVVEVFEFPEQRVVAADLESRFSAVRRGRAATSDIAVHFSRAALWRQPHVGMPPRLHELADALRDRADFAVVDGTLVAAGALAESRLLALPDPVAEPPAVQEALLRFVAGGGTLLVAPEAGLAAGPLAAVVEAAPIADDAVALGSAELAAAERACGRARAFRIALGTPGEAAWLAGEWHAPEDAAQFQETAPRGVKARWSGRGAALVMPRSAGRRALLELEAWVHPRFAPQRVEIRVDGIAVGALERLGLQRFAVWLPVARSEASPCASSGASAGTGTGARAGCTSSLPPASASTLAIDADLRVPVALGLGDDRRALGVALIWVRLTPEGEPAARAIAIEEVAPVGVVDTARLAASSLAYGSGRIVRCGVAPFARFLALFEHLALTATGWGVGAPGDPESGARVPGVRLSRFEVAGGRPRWLAFNRGAREARLARPEPMPGGGAVEPVIVPSGLMAELP